MKISKLTYKFGRIHPFCFVISYFIMILLFATIYYFLPLKSFYHTTSKYEYSILDKEANQFLSKIKKSIIESNKIENNRIVFDTLSIDISQLRVHSLSVNEYPKYFTFQLSYFLYIRKDSGFIQMSKSPIIRTLLYNKTIFDNTITLPIEIDESKTNFMNSSYSSSKLFIQNNGNGIISNINYPHISIDLKLYNDLINIGNAYIGYPKNVSGHWLRSLYLSMGISTSTVFGDIVPLSSWSRFLVSFQGFFSILIFSLFINSIASFIGEKKKIISELNLKDELNLKEEQNLTDEKQIELLEKVNYSETNDMENNINDENIELQNDNKE